MASLVLRATQRAGLTATRAFSAATFVRASHSLPHGASSPTLTCPSAAPIADDPKDSKTGLGVTGVIPTESDQATGLERKEILAHLAGNTVRSRCNTHTSPHVRQDPFGLKGVKLGAWGTKDAPRTIPSHFDSRFVGCVCLCCLNNVPPPTARRRRVRC